MISAKIYFKHADILMKYKIFTLYFKIFFFEFLFKSRLCFYKNLLFFTISFLICQNIHFTDILIGTMAFNRSSLNHILSKSQNNPINQLQAMLYLIDKVYIW